MRSVSQEELLETAFDWLERVRSQSATDSDQRALEIWLSQSYLHEEAFERARTYDSAFDQLELKDIDASLLEPLAVEQDPDLKRRVISWFSIPSFQLAAAALALTAISLSIAASYILESASSAPDAPVLLAYETGLGEQKTIALPDGSAVTLDSRTTLTVEISDDSRSVRLNAGAAHFDVVSEPARPFAVSADNLTVTVRGTEFDVRNNAGVQRVGVAEGLVEVTYPFVLYGNPSQLSTLKRLAAGEQVVASLDEGLSTKSSIDPNRIALWRDRILFYERAPLEEMIADANRFSDREIILSEQMRLEGKTISGSFRTDDIDGMLAMISLNFDVAIDESDTGRIVLTPRY